MAEYPTALETKSAILLKIMTDEESRAIAEMTIELDRHLPDLIKKAVENRNYTTRYAFLRPLHAEDDKALIWLLKAMLKLKFKALGYDVWFKHTPPSCLEICLYWELGD